MSEGYMEKALLKLARQLNAYDEASLSDLWNKYEAKVMNFEPSTAWEEATVVYGMIQSIRLKNHLFNHHWGSSKAPENLISKPHPVVSEVESVSNDKTFETGESEKSGPDCGGSGSKRSKVLLFKPRDDS